MLDIFLLSFGSLFSITNPLGTVPIFVGLTSDDNSAEQTKTALLTGLNVGVILVVSFLRVNTFYHFLEFHWTLYA